MRVVRSLVLLAAGIVLWHPAVHGQRGDAAQVLAAAREALGGETTLAGVRTFVATGRSRQLRGNNLVPVEFEIACELPDKFVRKDEFPAQDSDLTVIGFRGDDLIQGPAAPPGRGGPAGGPGPQRLMSVKQDFVKLTLGVFAMSFSAYPLTFQYAAAGEAPEGKADVLNVSGPANFTARLVVQQQTHLPVMLMWEAPALATGGRGRGAGPVSGRGPDAPGQPAPGVEYRIYYADYRPVSGVKWPFRIRRAVSGETVEETTFDRVSINVKIDQRKFEAPK